MSGPLLEARGLTRTFASGGGMFGGGGSPVRAVDQVSFVVEPGETLALVGESGSGKSTTARMALRLLEPTSGELYFQGEDLLARRDLHSFRRKAQFIFQDPFSSLNPRHSIQTILAEPLRLHGLAPRAEIPERVRALLERVGLRAEHAQRYPHQFSGGQRQRIGIARALAVEPELIVADEPVSALDVSVQAQVLNLLLDLKEERGLSMLFIAHDLAVVRMVSQRVAVLYRGRLVELGSADAVCTAPLHPYTRALMAAAPFPDPGRRPGEPTLQLTASNSDRGCPYAGRCPLASAVCKEEIPALVEKASGHQVACHHEGPG
ncbi:ABC transporter ATP-binding protein [bacterium CPR1]|nr:ABC transporter ATP-binding protein [bacterium CPR1]